MFEMKRLIPLAAVFVGGCMPPTSIRIIHSPQPWERWEYACMKPASAAGAAADLASEANRYGADGWELAASDGGVWCFKRPVGGGPAPAAQP
jgi:hypothetical protein